MLYQITSPYFCAGIIVTNGWCTQAAPIVHYMKGKSSTWIASYIQKKGWKVICVTSDKPKAR